MKINNSLGFSLIELIISMAILAIIAVIAIPSYQQAILASHRSDAKSALLILQLEQEKWRASHVSYATLDQLPINTLSSNGFYQLSMSTQLDSDQFFALATPLKQQVNDSCGIYALNQNGAVYKNYANQSCWGE